MIDGAQASGVISGDDSAGLAERLEALVDAAREAAGVAAFVRVEGLAATGTDPTNAQFEVVFEIGPYSLALEHDSGEYAFNRLRRTLAAMLDQAEGGLHGEVRSESVTGAVRNGKALYRVAVPVAVRRRPAGVGLGAGRPRPTAAMILAAGLGTRLRPLTERLPKCMVAVAGKPLLEHAVERLREHGMRELVVNLHHEPDAVVGYFGDGSRWGVRITYHFEQSLLGTAGSVAAGMASATEPFFVWYADNISTCRLDRMWDAHVHNDALVTVALTATAEPTRGGIAALGQGGRIVRFVEKPPPHEVFSRLVSAGIMVLEPEAVALIPEGRPCDFGHDVLPLLAARGDGLFGYRMGVDEVLLCSDRPADLERTRRIVSPRSWTRKAPAAASDSGVAGGR